MHELLVRRNSDFAKAFSSSDTRSVCKLLPGDLFAPFHFDVLHAKKAAPAANNAKALSIPENSSGGELWFLPHCRGTENLATLLAKRCVDARPRRECTLQIKNLRGPPHPGNSPIFFFDD